MKFKVITLGCKVNAFESETYYKDLVDANFTPVENNADIYIINSCAVTNAAAKKSQQRINQAYRENNEAIIVVIGCYAQVESEKLAYDDKVSLVVGSNQKSNLLPLLRQVIENKKVVAVDKNQRDFVYEDLGISHFSNKQRAFLKIQDGCDQFCSYCIIPFARGKERSQNVDLVLENAKTLTNLGHKEIVLSGINTGRYGLDINTNLENLITNMISDIDKLERLRVSSIEVLEVSDNIIELAKNNEVFANHWHIPLQSGNDKLLKAMNRRYTKQQYADKINYLKANLDNVAISADVIVGFPNESEEDFLETYNFIKSLDLAFLHVFPYSPKSKTIAANMDNQIPNDVKKKRVNKLLKLSKNLKINYINKFVNKDVKVLVEGLSDGYYKGYASEYFEVRFKSDQDLVNQIVNVNILDVKGEVAYGSIN